jgi:hypothetical protein
MRKELLAEQERLKTVIVRINLKSGSGKYIIINF